MVRVKARYKLNVVFRFNPVCSKFKLKFSTISQFFGLKTSSHGKPDQKNEFLRSGYHVKWSAENMNFTMLKPG